MKEQQKAYMLLSIFDTKKNNFKSFRGFMPLRSTGAERNSKSIAIRSFGSFSLSGAEMNKVTPS